MRGRHLNALAAPKVSLALAQAVIYLASAPKSNAAYIAFNQAMQDAKTSGSLEVPLHLRNAPTKLMKSLDYGKGYRYAHDEADGFASGETYFPEALGVKRYYQPKNNGLEIKIKAKLDELRRRNGGNRMKLLAKEIVAVALGGGVGSVLRFALSRWVQSWVPGRAFPWGMFVCNVLGCLLVGLLAGILIHRMSVGPLWRAGILIGVLGGFTSFSSFSLDTSHLIAGRRFILCNCQCGVEFGMLCARHRRWFCC